jgi:hypothetical protein
MKANLTEWLIRLSFAVAGVIHVLPLAGVLGRAVLEPSYGVRLGDGHDLEILLRHRALMFGILAATCFFAVAQPQWRTPVGLAAMLSMLGFALIASLQPHSAALAKVLWIDLLGSALLGVGLLLHFFVSRPES